MVFVNPLIFAVYGRHNEKKKQKYADRNDEKNKETDDERNDKHWLMNRIIGFVY